jgi:hypothetical protein
MHYPPLSKASREVAFGGLNIGPFEIKPVKVQNSMVSSIQMSGIFIPLVVLEKGPRKFIYLEINECVPLYVYTPQIVYFKLYL